MQADVGPHLATSVFTIQNHELAGKEDAPRLKALGCIATRPALTGIVMATRLDRHSHRSHRALGDQVK